MANLLDVHKCLMQVPGVSDVEVFETIKFAKNGISWEVYPTGGEKMVLLKDGSRVFSFRNPGSIAEYLNPVLKHG